MKYNDFGKTGLKVSEIAFGGASIAGEGKGYGFGEMSEKDAIKILNISYEKGVNLFDNAPIYGFSLSEKRMGKAFKAFREKVILTSKSGVSWHDNGRVNMSNDPLITKKMLEQSLRDFDTDYIDLYMIHWPDEKVDIRFPLEVLSKAKAEGKIKYIGLCNTTLSDYEKASEVDTVDFLQAEHNFFNHSFYKTFKEKLGPLGFMGWGGLDKGILTGRVSKNRTYDKTDARSWAPWWKSQDLDKKLAIVDKLKSFCKSKDISLLEFIVNYNLSFENYSTMLSGFKNEKDLDSILSARKLNLSYEVFEEAASLF